MAFLRIGFSWSKQKKSNIVMWVNYRRAGKNICCVGLSQVFSFSFFFYYHAKLTICWIALYTKLSNICFAPKWKKQQQQSIRRLSYRHTNNFWGQLAFWLIWPTRLCCCIWTKSLWFASEAALAKPSCLTWLHAISFSSFQWEDSQIIPL